jgi:hypothetical protein
MCGVLAGAVGAGCGDRHSVEHEVWTLFDMSAAFGAGDTAPVAEMGVPAYALLERDTDGVVHLKVQRAFADGQPAAFVTTEIWVNHGGGVWVQPLYAQSVDGQLLVAGAPRVIDVGPESSFYSPFWQVNVAVVGDVPADRYRSSKQLLDAASAIVPTLPHTCPLRPLDMAGSIALPPPWDAWNIPLRAIPMGEAVYDDQGASTSVGLFDFGVDLFRPRADARDGTVVEELPMFVFADADGALLVDVPRVAGTAPRPGAGALWRIHKAILPTGAGAFHGSAHPTAVASLPAGSDALELEGRVALDAGCFDDTAGFPDGCVWLDSQAQLASFLGGARLQPTATTATCPLVLYDKEAVAR